MVNDEIGKPSSDGYKGHKIFSEDEARFIKKYVDMEDVKVTVSYHTLWKPDFLMVLSRRRV